MAPCRKKKAYATQNKMATASATDLRKRQLKRYPTGKPGCLCQTLRQCYLCGADKLIVLPTQILLVPLFRTRCCYYEPAHTARYTGEIRVEAVKNFLQLDSSEAA